MLIDLSIYTYIQLTENVFEKSLGEETTSSMGVRNGLCLLWRGKVGTRELCMPILFHIFMKRKKINASHVLVV